MNLYESIVGWLRRYRGAYEFLRSVRRAVLSVITAACRRVLPARWAFGPPAGEFRALDMVEQGRAEGRIFYRSQEVPPLVKGSLRDQCGLRQHECQPWPFFWSHHRNARLVGRNLLFVDERKRVCLEAGYYHHSLQFDPDGRYFIRSRPQRLEGRWTSLMSCWSNGFHHWFMDALPRLAALPEFPADTRVLVPARLEPYHLETLRWAGLEGRYRPTSEKHVMPDHFYFSSPTAMTGCYNPFAVDFLRRSFLSRADKLYDSPRRFYVQRVGVSRGVINEPEVLEFFRQRGWAIVDTARLSVAQQIQLFANAEALCALHGAALTNLLWCRPGTKVVELCASTFLNGVYEGLAQVVGARHRFMVMDADAAFRVRVDLKELERLISF